MRFQHTIVTTKALAPSCSLPHKDVTLPAFCRQCAVKGIGTGKDCLNLAIPASGVLSVIPIFLAGNL
jgi:hypothetical protein